MEEKLRKYILFEEKNLTPAILRMQKKLRKKGFKFGVIPDRTGNSEKTGNSERTGNSEKPGKLKTAMKALFENAGIKKPDAELMYVVGCSEDYIAEAHDNGTEFIGLCSYEETLESMTENHADYIVFSVSELEELLLRQTFEASQGRICRRKGETPAGLSDKKMLKTMLAVFGCIIGFIVVKGLSEVLLTSFGAVILSNVPDNIGNFLCYGAEPNSSGFYYNGNIGTIIGGLSYLIAAGGFFYPARKWIKATARDSYLLHPLRPTVWQILAAFVLTVSVVFAIQLAVILTGVAEKSADYTAISDNQYSCMFWLGMIVYGFAAPFSEELIFRGIVYGGFRRYMPLGFAMPVSALLFGIYHGNLVQGVYAFIMGFIMVWMYEYFGNFLFAFAVHVIANVISYAGSYTLMQNSFFVSWPVVAGMAVMAGAGLYLMIILKKRT